MGQNIRKLWCQICSSDLQASRGFYDVAFKIFILMEFYGCESGFKAVHIKDTVPCQEIFTNYVTFLYVYQHTCLYFPFIFTKNLSFTIWFHRFKEFCFLNNFFAFFHFNFYVGLLICVDECWIFYHELCNILQLRLKEPIMSRLVHDAMLLVSSSKPSGSRVNCTSDFTIRSSSGSTPCIEMTLQIISQPDIMRQIRLVDVFQRKTMMFWIICI